MDSITDLAPRLRRKEISPVEILQDCLRGIEQQNPALNAFITVTAKSAMAEARAAAAEIQRGEWRGPLHGIPVALKDLIDTAGTLTTSGSALHRQRVPTEDAEVVRRLRQAGAVIVGKNNLHEFAYGGSSLVSYFGDVHNPRSPAHIAGGSSGGSAAAVVAGLCYAAMGTDTAGSVREPAALCGCVGLKPTYGRVSKRGVTPLSWTLDHVGPITANVQDAALLLQSIAGYDARDPHSCDIPVSDYSSPEQIVSGQTKAEIKKLRIGIPRAYFYDDLDAEVSAAVQQALRVIAALVAEVRDIPIEVPTDRTLQAAEAYAYHAESAARTPHLYQPETLRRILGGADISAAEYIARREELEAERRRSATFFADVDLLVTPTIPIPAPRIAGLKKNPDNLRPAELILLRNTRPFNVWGLPAISVPCGVTSSNLPIGLQIAGPHWREDRVLALARAYEQRK